MHFTTNFHQDGAAGGAAAAAGMAEFWLALQWYKVVLHYKVVQSGTTKWCYRCSTTSAWAPAAQSR